MFKDTILRRIVVIILLSVLLSAVLTTAAFYYSGGRVFSGIKAKELRPRAEYLANITAEYLQGLITKETYERSIGRGFKVWDASMYAYDACGDLFAYPANEDSTVNKDALAVCKALQEIAGNYKISIHTRIINTAVKVICIKIDNMNFNCD